VTVSVSERQMDVTMKLEVVAVGKVNMPQGTFDGLLKLLCVT